MKTALVCGAGGFIGNHLVKRLKEEGMLVRGVDLKYPEFSPVVADEFIIGDLRDVKTVSRVIDRPFDEVYQLAADMGGAGYLFTGDNDADVMTNSAHININVLNQCRVMQNRRVFFSSSACVYPRHNQNDCENPICEEDSVYPADPDSEYGWEKLFAERLYLSHNRNHHMECRIARYHNIFGPEGTWRGGREKAPAALCRKIASIEPGGEVEIWGNGEQTRSFLYIDECIEATVRLMRSDVDIPINIGSEEMISINDLVDLISDISGKIVHKRYVDGPVGVLGRTSDNRLIGKMLGWKPLSNPKPGLETTYRWIEEEVKRNI